MFYVSFVCNFLYIFSIDFISAFSKFFSCIQTICNDSLLLFSSQKQYKLHIYMSGLRNLYIIIIRPVGLSICKIFKAYS